jgi:hypothetical protein
MGTEYSNITCFAINPTIHIYVNITVEELEAYDAYYGSDGGFKFQSEHQNLPLILLSFNGTKPANCLNLIYKYSTISSHGLNRAVAPGEE